MDIYVRDIDQSISLESLYIAGLPDRRRQTLQWRFAEFVAKRYRERVKRAVLRQEYSGVWVPLSEKYKDSKIRTGLNPGMWIATSELINSIVAYRRSNDYVVGVDRRKVHKGSKTRLWIIAKALEFGTGRIPPRPLLLPVKREIYRDMESIRREFLGQKEIREYIERWVN